MDIRTARHGDLDGVLGLYAQLHGNPVPSRDSALEALWARILADPNQRLLVGEADGELVASCVLIVVPNLTQGQRPYALIENVITDQRHRRRGYATRLLGHARELAVRDGCYKIMLMTGSKLDATLRFYEKAGYNRTDKTAFVQWL